MEFVGHEATLSMLDRHIQAGTLPQSVLLVGPTHIGKTTLAVDLAKRIQCERPSLTLACNQCNSCKRIQSNEHPEVSIIEPDGDITKIWQLWSRSGHPPGALESLVYRPVLGAKRVVIITAAHTLNDESANSILKVLEEPASYVQFFLCTNSVAAVLPTISSRCFTITLTPLPMHVIEELVISRRSMDETNARQIAQEAVGCPGKALTVNVSDLDDRHVQLTAWIARLQSAPRGAIFALAETLRAVQKGTPEGAVRGVTMHNLRALATLLMTTDIAVTTKITCADDVMATAYAVSRNANPQMATEALLTRLWKRLHNQ